MSNLNEFNSVYILSVYLDMMELFNHRSQIALVRTVSYDFLDLRFNFYFAMYLIFFSLN